jgi:hypothetical protein
MSSERSEKFLGSFGFLILGQIRIAMVLRNMSDMR